VRRFKRNSERASGLGPIRTLRAAIVAATLFAYPSLAQVGPVEGNGYLEYRYYLADATGSDLSQSHAATLRTNWSTFLWRPWILTANASLAFTEQATDTSLGSADASSVGGSVRLQFLARSRFPFSVFYEDNETDAGGEEFGVMNRRGWGYGFSQQLSTRRFGNYSLNLDRRSTRTHTTLEDVDPRLFSIEVWRFTGLKSFGANGLSLETVRRDIEGGFPSDEAMSLRTTLRHVYRPAPKLNVRNTFYLNDEDRRNGLSTLEQSAQQFLSTVFWRPGDSQRLQLSARVFARQFESTSGMMDIDVTGTGVGGTASYQLTRQWMVSASAGMSATEGSGQQDTDSTYLDFSTRYMSKTYELWGGRFSNASQFRVGAKSDDIQGMQNDVRAAGLSTSNAYSRSMSMFGRLPLRMQVSQRLGTNHDSTGAETNFMQHTLNLAWTRRQARSALGTRFSVTDYQSYGDDSASRQFANLEFSAERNRSRDVSFSGSASVQWATRSIEKPVEAASQNDSLYYSVSLGYRHANLRDIAHLNFSSDLRYRDEGQQSLDPLDPDFESEFERTTLSWRNRLSYRVGLLDVHANLHFSELSGSVLTVFSLRVRRYFGA